MLLNKLPLAAILFGVMLESHLHPGNQSTDGNLAYGVSITDKCMGWEETLPVFDTLAAAVRSCRSA